MLDVYLLNKVLQWKLTLRKVSGFILITNYFNIVFYNKILKSYPQILLTKPKYKFIWSLGTSQFKTASSLQHRNHCQNQCPKCLLVTYSHSFLSITLIIIRGLRPRTITNVFLQMAMFERSTFGTAVWFRLVWITFRITGLCWLRPCPKDMDNNQCVSSSVYVRKKHHRYCFLISVGLG